MAATPLDAARRRPTGSAVAPSGGVARQVPHNLQAEESLLGAMLLSREAIAIAVEAISADDFYRPVHGHIFEAITSLYAQGEGADPVTVADELNRAGLLDAVGGLPALLDLQGNTPAISNAARYAHIVEEHALLRRLIGVASQIAELGYEVPDDVEAAVDRAESLVFEVAQRRVTDTIAPLHDLLGKSLDRLEALYGRGEGITGVPTGYLDLDEQLSGLQPGSLVIVGARPSMGKALALDTPLPTPGGWTTMGDVRPGDDVIDAQGKPCRVLYTSPVFLGNRCYEVTFDDGSKIVADAGHCWLSYDLAAWESPRMGHPRVVTTQQMVDEGVRVGGRPNWHVPLVGGLDLPEQLLPVDPYVLGWWLGGGATADAGSPGHPEDSEHFAGELSMAGYAVEPVPGGPLGGAADPVQGSGDRLRVLTRELQAAGLFEASSKHIPQLYMRASHKQRLALLQGLLDTIGAVTDAKGTVELCLANRALLEQAWEIVASLGHKPHPIVHREIPLPDGRVAEAWRFRWTPLDPVFRLPRKAERLSSTVSRPRNGRSTRRAIVTIRGVPSVPVRCIAVDSAEHLFLAGRAMIPTHNTAFGLGIAAHAAMEAHKGVLFFSLEMGHLEVTQRLLSAEARVDSSRMRNGRLQEQDWGKISHAIGRLGEAPLYIDENAKLTLMDVRAKARRLKSKLSNELGLVVIDYLQLMTGRQNAENRQVEVAEISRGLKILARELEVPVVALCQLNRSLEARADKRPMLADLRESGCMPATTRLMRADNGAEVTLGELVLSQEQPLVWSLDEHWRLVPRRLIKAFPSGIKPVFRLRLASGYEVEATANHPFRTLEGWSRLDELAPGTAIAVPRRVPAPLREGQPWDDDELVLLAHLLGDGSMGPNSVKYATSDGANKAVVEAAARRLFGIEATAELRGRTWQMWLASPYRLTHGRRHPVRNWLEPLGLWGARSHTKFVPEEVFGLADDQVALFLRHLWATDGSITIGRNARGRLVNVYYATTSRRLADGVRRLLLRLDVRSRVRRARKNGYRDSWHVAVEGAPNVARFLSVVGCHGERGRCIPEALAIVEALQPNPNVDLVPWSVSQQVKAAMAASGTTHRELADGLGERYCGGYLLGTSARPRRFSRRRLQRMAEITNDPQLRDLATSDVFWDEVVEIVPIGEMPTFDATVEGTHNFVADGIIAHNSLEQDADVVMFLYRDEVYNAESPDRGTAEVIVAKHRNGPTGVCRLAWLDHYTRFANMARGS